MNRPSGLKRRIGELKQTDWSRREIRSNRQTENIEEFFMAIAILLPILLSTMEKKQSRTQFEIKKIGKKETKR